MKTLSIMAQSFFGYVHDETKLKSWKYLKKLGKLDEIGMDDEDTWWDGYVGEFELSEKEFNLFVGYYIKDLVDKYGDASDFMKDMYPILKEPGGKIISWI